MPRIGQRGDMKTHTLDPHGDGYTYCDRRGSDVRSLVEYPKSPSYTKCSAVARERRLDKERRDELNRMQGQFYAEDKAGKR